MGRLLPPLFKVFKSFYYSVVTVTVQLAEYEPAVQVTTAVPAATPVTTPVLLTVATLVLLLAQTTGLPLGVVVGVIVAVLPTVILEVVGDMLRAVTLETASAAIVSGV